MTAIALTSHILGVMTVVSFFLWCGVGYRLWAMARSKSTILEGKELPAPTDTSVSIVVPAHNEERVIDECATSLRNQSYSDIQIIFVLDRCSDNTLEILRKHASEDSRIQLVEIDTCPVDWAGEVQRCLGRSKTSNR